VHCEKRMRDTRNPLSIRSAYDELSGLLAEFRERAQNATDAKKAEMLGRYALRSDIDYVSAGYSLGLDLKDLQPIVLSLMDDFKSFYFYRRPFYIDLLEVLSLAILTNLSSEYVQRVSEVISRDEVSDKLLNYLLLSTDPIWNGNSKSFIQTKPYSQLNEAIEQTDEIKGIQEIGKYLKSWYVSNKHTAWYGTHLLKEDNSYTGYWCWEAAAIVKVKGWDDAKLKDYEYYPYDAVHW